MAKEIFEWRGVSDVVAAEVITDTDENLEFGDVFNVAGVAELGRTTENATETHYYDNSPAIVITSTGADTVTLTLSGIPMDVLAKITGQRYDATKGMLIEGIRESKYFALGYKTKKTNGNEVYVWRFKGSFSIPDSQHTTEKNDATANGQSVTFTGIATTYKFNTLVDDDGNKLNAKAINIDVGLGLVDVSNFFASVQTPDSLTAKKVATPTAIPAAGSIPSGNTVYLQCATDGATIYYTTDGSTPTTASTEYTTGIIVSATTTIKAIAVKASLTNSDVATFAYTVG